MNRLIYKVQAQNAVRKDSQEGWMLGIDGEKESGNLMLSARLDEADYEIDRS